MPILKKNDPIPEQPVVICLYGEPGSCKTSLGNTAADVLVLDADRGVSRSYNRQDTLVINSWEEVDVEMKNGSFKHYKTIVIDTAKAVLDDFLMTYVIKRDIKLKANKLRAYGEIGDEFKLFVNYCRSEGKDLIIIAHAKKDEDTKKSIPDVTGQSYQLILRISDQVGYVSFINNVRNIQWTPTDLTVGKNTANLPMIQIPPKESAEFKTFMAGVIDSVKKAKASMSEAQRAAMEQMEVLQGKLQQATTPDLLTELLAEVNTLEAHLKLPMQKLIREAANTAGYIANKETKRYELPQPEKSGESPINQQEAEDNHSDAMPSQPPTDQELTARFNQRCRIVEDAGVQLEEDRFTYGDNSVTYDDLDQMDDTAFNDLLLKITKAISAKRRPQRKATA